MQSSPDPARRLRRFAGQDPLSPARERAWKLAAGRWRCFGHAMRGLLFLVRSEPNAKLHLAATAAVATLGALLGLGAGEWRWLVLAAALVWAAEAFNTAVEQVCNLVSPGFDPRVEAAKDVAAGAVLVAAVAAAAIGAATLLPPLAAAMPVFSR
jgi:diacylglycerol kinase (ATP)